MDRGGCGTNTRQRKDAKRYSFGGRNLTLKEWSQELDVTVSTLRKRIRAGMPDEMVFSPDLRMRHYDGRYKRRYFKELEKAMEKKVEYKYGMRLRGFAPACQPMQGLIRREDDPSGRYWDILVYDRLLDGEELSLYSLDLVKVVDDGQGD